METGNRIPEDVIRLDEMRTSMWRLAEVLSHIDHQAQYTTPTQHEIEWCIEKGLVDQPQGIYTSGAHFVGPGQSLPPADKPVRLLTPKGHIVLKLLHQLSTQLW